MAPEGDVIKKPCEHKPLDVLTLVTESIQKGEKGGMANAKMYTFLERNIVGKAFICIN